jgi:hypothetical protein
MYLSFYVNFSLQWYLNAIIVKLIEQRRGEMEWLKRNMLTQLYVILTVHSIAIGSYLFIIPTHAQFYNIITSPLYVFRHPECHHQGVTVLKA